MTEHLRPTRGGFLCPFGCGWFIREFLLGHGPQGSPAINPSIGAPQADIFYHYKMALRKATAIDRATRFEEDQARREKRAIDPGSIESLTDKLLAHMPYKAHGCRYHPFVVYFSTLQRLDWVEPSGKEELSAFQDHYPPGPPRRYFRLTAAGRHAGNSAWSNPRIALDQCGPRAVASPARLQGGCLCVRFVPTKDSTASV